MRILAAFLFCASLFAAITNPTTYVLSVGANTFEVDDTSGASFSQAFTLPAINASTRRYKVWIDPTGNYAQRGNEAGCSAPCVILANTATGRSAINYEVTDASGTPLSPPVYSILQNFLQVTPPTHLTAPFAVPLGVHGFKDYANILDVAIPGGSDVSAVAAYIEGYNFLPGDFSVVGNSGTEHVITSTPIVGYVSAGGVGSEICTATTLGPHGLTTNQTIQQNGFSFGGFVGIGAVGTLNNTFTVASTPTASTYTVACPGIAAGDWNTGVGGVGVNRNRTVSGVNQYCGNDRWFGGMSSELQFTCLMIPVGATEFTAGATNTLTLRFKGMPAALIQKYHLVHGVRLTDLNLIQTNKSCTITGYTTSGSNTTVACASHGFADGDTVMIPLASGPRWRFQGRRTILSHTTNAFVFATGTDPNGNVTTADASYPAGPTSNDAGYMPQSTFKAYRCLIPASDFTTPAAPSTFTGFGGNAATGATLWTSGTLEDPNPYFGANNISNTGLSGGHCSSCHAKDGMDLKKFGYEPWVIKIASMHRGLTETQANDVVEYILNRPYSTSTKGRPWNPPYQPSLGLDAGTVDNWEWGAGMSNILGDDPSMGEFLHPSGSYSTWAYNSEVNNRELPIPFGLAIWNQWLPKVAPEDACTFFGCTFSATTLSTAYEGYAATLKLPQQLASASSTNWTTSTAQACTNDDFFVAGEGSSRKFVQIKTGCGTTSGTWLINQTIQGITTSGVPSVGAWLSDYTAYVNSGTYLGSMFTGLDDFEHLYPLAFSTGSSTGMEGAYQNPSMYVPSGVATAAWTLTKYWELFSMYRLQEVNDIAVRGKIGLTSISSNSGAQYQRGWAIMAVFHRGIHKLPWPGNSAWFGNVDSGFEPAHFNFETMVWYQAAQVLTLDDRLNKSDGAIDWQYTDQYITNSSQYWSVFNMKTLWFATSIQQTLGFVTPFVGGVNFVMSLEPLAFGKSFLLQYPQQFSDQTTVGNYVKQTALLTAAIIPLYSTADWQTFMALSAPLGQALDIPNAALGNLGQGGFASQTAVGLAVMSYYGANSTAMGTIKTWANAVWTATGHDFQTDIDVGPMCSLVATPQRLDCPTFH